MISSRLPVSPAIFFFVSYVAISSPMVLDLVASLASVCDGDVSPHDVPRRCARVDAMSFNFLLL